MSHVVKSQGPNLVGILKRGLANNPKWHIYIYVTYCYIKTLVLWSIEFENSSVNLGEWKMDLAMYTLNLNCAERTWG